MQLVCQAVDVGLGGSVDHHQENGVENLLYILIVNIYIKQTMIEGSLLILEDFISICRRKSQHKFRSFLFFSLWQSYVCPQCFRSEAREDRKKKKQKAVG